MDRMMPDLFFHVGGTHVHHLNYGIFLLSGIGGYILVARPTGRPLDVSTVIYAIGLALTFDEFGMWLHLGGEYWQRASFDAVITISAMLTLMGFSPDVRHWTKRRWLAFGILVVAMCIFVVFFANSLKHAKDKLAWKLHTIEANSPQ